MKIIITNESAPQGAPGKIERTTCEIRFLPLLAASIIGATVTGFLRAVGFEGWLPGLSGFCLIVIAAVWFNAFVWWREELEK